MSLHLKVLNSFFLFDKEWMRNHRRKIRLETYRNLQIFPHFFPSLNKMHINIYLVMTFICSDKVNLSQLCSPSVVESGAIVVWHAVDGAVHRRQWHQHVGGAAAAAPGGTDDFIAQLLGGNALQMIRLGGSNFSSVRDRMHLLCLLWLRLCRLRLHLS